MNNGGVVCCGVLGGALGVGVGNGVMYLLDVEGVLGRLGRLELDDCSSSSELLELLVSVPESLSELLSE